MKTYHITYTDGFEEFIKADSWSEAKTKLSKCGCMIKSVVES